MLQPKVMFLDSLILFTVLPRVNKLLQPIIKSYLSICLLYTLYITLGLHCRVYICCVAYLRFVDTIWVKWHSSSLSPDFRTVTTIFCSPLNIIKPMVQCYSYTCNDITPSALEKNNRFMNKYKRLVQSN